MTERELKQPYKATHNLAKPPKLAKPLKAGDDIDALHGGTHKHRIARYRKAIRILERLIADDEALEQRIRGAATTTPPTSGTDHPRTSASPEPDGEGTSGISDPTGNAATSHRIKDPAERAWNSADEAMKALWWADQHRSRAIRMTDSDSPEAKARYAREIRQLADRTEAELIDTGCTNCAKIGEYSTRGEAPAVPKDCTWCRWCYEFQRAHDGVLPTRSLLRIHHGPKGKVTTRDVEKALHSVRPTQPAPTPDPR